MTLGTESPALGPLMLDLKGLSLAADEAEILRQPEVGGLILFARNYESPEQLHALMAEVRNARPDILVSVDQEGGRVQRLREGVTRLPPMAALGERWKLDRQQAVEEAHELGWLMAAELRDFDIDFSFAPVLDRDWSRSGVIGDRAFAGTVEGISELAVAFMSGMHEAGMAATGKHFPGHGWVVADSHLEIPVDERSLEEIGGEDMRPFATLIGEGLDAIMPAHVIYSAVNEEPAGFSEFWLQQQLRQRLGFNGVIFSDDLTMEGASVAGGYPQRAEKALRAGCDMVLVCNRPEGALEVLEYLQQHPVAPSPRLGRMKARVVALDDARRRERARQIAQQLIDLMHRV
ncbi:beta-N-acetylhexosaminidase [Marinobacterium mangrovicola]|uniref:Beta-hexosaminidase n=1 Tax=Marinobacterium mangrovicola TaxID=1476959 RepID=A0A4R1GWR8_9GAMM|nr:beta-N-acetylhexosaminidase [Marinobacterium mangrovicola]TCK08872.1 beta-N-acetylhexosaminidase [Marinobacterium mangrovicola]